MSRVCHDKLQNRTPRRIVTNVKRGFFFQFFFYKAICFFFLPINLFFNIENFVGNRKSQNISYILLSIQNILKYFKNPNKILFFIFDINY